MPRRTLLIASLIALLALLLTDRTLHPFRTLVVTVISPLAGPLTDLTQSFRTISTTVRDIRTLRDRVESLTAEAEALKANLAELDALRHENELLRGALKFSETQRDQSLIAARVISRSPTRFFQSVTINRGEADGIQDHAPVVANGFLIGQIVERFPHQAIVRLVTASDSLIAVVFTESRAQGLLRGGLTGLAVTDVPADVSVPLGAAVVTSGIGGGLPAGIPVGEAGESTAQPSSVLQRIAIRSSLVATKLEIVFVGQPVVSQP